MIGCLLALCFCAHTVLAADANGILSFGTEGKDIVMYVQNPGEGCEIQCQVGTSEAEKIESHPIEQETVPIETIILLDNSLSVVEKYRPTISAVMSELAANRMNGEQFTIAVFSDEINYLVEKCSDYAQVKQAVDNITYNNQETYLTDVLYHLLSEIKEEDNTENKAPLRRIVIISDGVDNKSIGYTKEELYAALEKMPYPIYTVGCTYKENNEQLKNMFALSRMTGGASWLLDDVSDYMEIVNGISSLNQALKIVVTPQEKDCDGTTKGIHLRVDSEGGQISGSIEITMPFGKVEEVVETPVPEVLEETPSPTAEPVPEPAEPTFPAGLTLVLAVGGGVLLMAGVVFGVLTVRWAGRKKEDFVSAGPRNNASGDSSGGGESTRKRETQMVGGDKDSGQRSTKFVGGQEAARTLILEDVANPIKRFEVSLDTSLLVGYDRDCRICLNYEETVSGKHCRIYTSDGKVYVENLSRSNGTFVDGKKIGSPVEIYTGCVLKLGNLQMRVEIR